MFLWGVLVLWWSLGRSFEKERLVEKEGKRGSMSGSSKGVEEGAEESQSVMCMGLSMPVS